MALKSKTSTYLHKDVNSLLISNGEIDIGKLVKSISTFESDQLFRPVVIEVGKMLLYIIYDTIHYNFLIML